MFKWINEYMHNMMLRGRSIKPVNSKRNAKKGTATLFSSGDKTFIK